MRALAETAVQRNELGDLEGFYMDLLSLGRRLDWTQLCELVRRTDSVRTVGEYAHLARVAPDQLPFIYSAALLSNSADRVASYLIRYGKAGSEDLRLALTDGQGAVNLLLQREVPVNRSPGPGNGGRRRPRSRAPAPHALRQVRGLHSRALPAPARPRPLDRVARGRSVRAARTSMCAAGILAVVMSALLIVATEPFLLKAAPAVGIPRAPGDPDARGLGNPN